MYKCESWIVKKVGRRKIDYFEIWYLEESSTDTLDHQKDQQCILEQIKPETSQEANYKTNIILLHTHHKNAELFGKDNNARKK